jgi:hypothetical protein
MTALTHGAFRAEFLAAEAVNADASIDVRFLLPLFFIMDESCEVVKKNLRELQCRLRCYGKLPGNNPITVSAEQCRQMEKGKVKYR